ncbi:nucleoside 2-deoxyribosyltransferase [Rhodohalobacter sp. SW132]|uniref:nucleoside 2-deoxyribosyltransferase n=1 Tax=Rhodohalobacter sp. SW132 TaxID=2293433 RepID=UPI000E27E877|nr:nucleoside 2-deoxyribosyltransferase [Rhodohalobacter sp. SW132]REL32881.1 nucleoside 2-deoxyribosyltransferase [Rhodohalobacter sp. SW132]
MNIYFSGSIRGGRQDAELYKQLIEHLKQYGTVLTEHIGYENISHSKTDREIHDEDMAWLRESDIVIAEVTTPSLGVGYEIGRAVEMEKRIVCLYRNIDGSKVSAMLKGSPNFQCKSYQTIEEAKTILSGFISE